MCHALPTLTHHRFRNVSCLFKDARSRLTRRMALRGFRIKDVPGDNNRQFHLPQVRVNHFFFISSFSFRMRVITLAPTPKRFLVNFLFL